MKFSFGITGNYYVTGFNKPELLDLCQKIGKAKTSVKWYNESFGWVFRVKNTQTKKKLKQLLGTFGSF